ncbi:peroxiredoxin [Carnimonas nigrificans]|uniref:peroxiredoxin n=1 Tax=Carnimonas nigrificans TaxID=64323 RepID=UPI000470F882|nr:peroxiredoxin [Carnimonas nigrificans]
MSLQLGDTAPDFTQQSTEGDIHFHDWIGDSWAILFSHPADFTPVCSTELGQVAHLKPEWDKRNTKPIGLSVDGLSDHEKWDADIKDISGTNLNFPLLADADRKVSELYDLIHPNADATATVRSVFFIDPNKKIRASITYPPSAGRNFKEILRVLDSLQLTDKEKVTTPVDWTPGERVIIAPSVSNEDAEKLFPQGWEEKKSYLRLVALDKK